MFAFTCGFAFIILFSLSSCNKSDNNSSAKFQQYYLQGEKLYLANCSNCHQKDGSGLGLLYPPLNQSDYMDKNTNDVLCLMKYGIEGELTVNGKIYNQPMPGVSSLTDLEIAEIATYIYNSWDHKKGIIEVQSVSSVISVCDSARARL